ncbi:MAG: hypothetical protein QM775_36660 [Pirellulales bacterium]
MLHFFGPDGRRYDLRATPGLPAPLHLLPSLMRLGYLSMWERLSAIAAVGRLACLRDRLDERTVGDWLREQRQTPRAVERFWAPVLLSALGETLDKASLKYARKVYVDGFLANREAFQVDVPACALSELFGERVPQWFARARGRCELRPRGSLDSSHWSRFVRTRLRRRRAPRSRASRRRVAVAQSGRRACAARSGLAGREKLANYRRCADLGRASLVRSAPYRTAARRTGRHARTMDVPARTGDFGNIRRW